MNKRDIVLAAFAPAHGESYTPVQAQKLLFLIDRNIASHVDGPHFDFQPYDYGPFDNDVYRVLEELESEGLVETTEAPGCNWKRYGLTESGIAQGQTILDSISEVNIRKYIADLSSFVRRLTFPQLVSAIYKAYPEMKVNSVFGDR